MYYLAFDVSKDKLDCVLTNLKTKTKYFQLNNTKESISQWLDGRKLPKRLIMGCESTGGYHLALARVCAARGYHFKIINPILTKQFIRSTIRKRKTDMSDCLVIAKLLAQGNGAKVSKETDATPKVEQRMFQKILQTKARFTLMRQSLKLHEQNESLEDLDRRLNAVQTEIRKAADNHKTHLQKKYLLHSTIRLLQSIPGIGFQLAFVIWTEIGDISRFSSPKQLIAFAGLDPRIRQSGMTLNSYGRLTKRGSPYLRGAIFLAARTARIFDPELRDFYEKKRAEGKKYTVAVCATARKLIIRIYAVWKRGTPYTKCGENGVYKKGVALVATPVEGK